MTEFEILAVSGREEAQKFNAKLPTKADKFNGKRISLNERFSVIERGFYLHATNISDYETLPVQVTVEKKHFLPKNQFVEKYLAAHPVLKIEEKEEEFNDENAQPLKKNVNQIKNIEFEPTDKENVTPDAYFNSIKKQLSPSH